MKKSLFAGALTAILIASSAVFAPTDCLAAPPKHPPQHSVKAPRPSAPPAMRRQEMKRPPVMRPQENRRPPAVNRASENRRPPAVKPMPSANRDFDKRPPNIGKPSKPNGIDRNPKRPAPGEFGKIQAAKRDKNKHDNKRDFDKKPVFDNKHDNKRDFDKKPVFDNKHDNKRDFDRKHDDKRDFDRKRDFDKKPVFDNKHDIGKKPHDIGKPPHDRPPHDIGKKPHDIGKPPHDRPPHDIGKPPHDRPPHDISKPPHDRPPHGFDKHPPKPPHHIGKHPHGKYHPPRLPRHHSRYYLYSGFYFPAIYSGYYYGAHYDDASALMNGITVCPADHPNIFLLNTLMTNNLYSDSNFAVFYSGQTALDYDEHHGTGAFYRLAVQNAPDIKKWKSTGYIPHTYPTVTSLESYLSKYHFIPSSDTLFDGKHLYRFDADTNAFVENQTIEGLTTTYKHGKIYLIQAAPKGELPKYYLVLKNAIYETDYVSASACPDYREINDDTTRLWKMIK